MSNAIKPPGETQDFAPFPMGTHIARCIRVVDLGTQSVAKFGVPGAFEDKGQSMLIFEFPYETMEKDGVVMPLIKSRTYTKSMHENSTLRGHLKNWRGADYTSDELQNFNLNNVCGQPCQITIIHSKSADGTKTYAKIDGISGLAKGMTCPDAYHTPFVYEIEEGIGGHFSELPEWVQETILKAKEWQVAPSVPEPTPSPVGTVVIPATNQGVPAPSIADIDEVMRTKPPF